LSLLFAASARPEAEAIRAISESCRSFAISHDPAQAHAQSPLPDSDSWLELVADGLTFDITGLAPGAAATAPECAYRFDIAPRWEPQGLEAVCLMPGPHLISGARMMPVVRAMSGLVARLCALPGVQAVVWHPSRCCIGPRYFSSIIDNWLEGGVFPGLGLVGLSASADGGLQSEGLAFFIGQELRIEPELAEDKAAAAKIAVRLIDRLVERGPLDSSETMTGTEGRALYLEPSTNRRFIRVWSGG